MKSYKVKAKKRQPDGSLKLTDTGLQMHYLGSDLLDTVYLAGAQVPRCDLGESRLGRKEEWRPGLLLSVVR